MKIDQNIKEEFQELVQYKFGNGQEASNKALDEALKLWIMQEKESKNLRYLIDELKYRDSFTTRRNAAFKLGKYNEKKAVNALIKAIEKDEDIHVRRRATASLGKIGSKKAVEYLIYLLDNEDSTIRAHALNYLSDMDYSLLELLLEYCNSKNKRIRSGCISAIGQILSNIQLYGIMDSLSHSLRDDEDIVKWRAASAFSYIGLQHSMAQKALIELLDDESLKVRLNALEALGYIGTEDAICPIIQLKQDDDPRIQEAANNSWELIEKRINDGKI